MSDSGMRSATGEQPGTIIGFEYEVRYVNWLKQVSWVYQERIPVRRTEFTLQLPAGWEYKSAWSGGKNPTPDGLADNRWKWTQSDVPAIHDDEELMPHPYGLEARGEFPALVQIVEQAQADHGKTSLNGNRSWPLDGERLLRRSLLKSMI